MRVKLMLAPLLLLIISACISNKESPNYGIKAYVIQAPTSELMRGKSSDKRIYIVAYDKQIPATKPRAIGLESTQK